MKQQEPDRFERLVEDLEFFRECGGKPIPVCESADVLNLLRKEHAWMRRMVTNYLSKWTDRTGQSIDVQEAYGRHCRALQCREILAQLEQRRK